MKSFFFALGLGVCALGLAAPASVHGQIFGGRKEPTVATDAAAWVIADSTTGFVLDSSNAGKKLQVASLTKIATAMVVLDWAAAKGVDLGELATVPQTAAALASPNSIGLQPGDQISLREALYAGLLQSDNAAAETLAVHVGRALRGDASEQGASDAFVAQMNALAHKLEMKSTRFLNPHGLDDLENKLPYSTAGDMAKLTNYALTKSNFTFFTAQKERKIAWQTAAGTPAGFLLKNTNELLGVGGVDGVKTGTTRKAGACVILSAAQKPESRQQGENHLITPRRLTVVVLASANRFETGKALLAQGWALMDQWSAAGRPVKGWKAGTAAR
jgi:D-alanyl-D-alanine carboxypeptidase (penicillin-binding protein 5/6)